MSFFMSKKKGGESKKGKPLGVPTRDILYSEAAKWAPRAIEILVEIMERGDGDNARMGAAKTILAKAIPDLKALEVTGEQRGPLIIKILEDKTEQTNE